MTDGVVAARHGAALRPWRLRTALRRAGTQWRLLVVVAVVAVLVTTLVASLSLLVTVTEERATRAVLSAATDEQTEVTLTFESLTVPLADVRVLATPSVAEVLGVEAPVDGVAVSEIFTVDRAEGRPAIAYFSEMDTVREHVALRAGVWPTDGGSAGGPVPVALSQAGAHALGVEVGDIVEVKSYAQLEVTVVQVVGLYRAMDVTDRYWETDYLDGAGHDPAFVAPGSGGQVTTDGVGPLVVAPGVLDANDIKVDELVLRYTPVFDKVTVGGLPPMLDRLATASDDVLADVGDVADRASYHTRLELLVKEITTALVVTRASVLVIGLLLVLLAVAALLQAARLLAEARHNEHNLMRARGASGRQLLSLAAMEAVVVAALAAGVGPPAARWVYQMLARREAMTEAGMAVDPGTPKAAWLTAAAVAVLLAVVVVSPLLRRAGTFVEGEQIRARPDRRAILARSGLDLLLLVLAGVAYWQLQSYRSPVGGGAGGSSLFVDPILVAGPAIVLLAGALLSVRLLPAASRLAESIAARGRGVVSPLAAWEVGRRSTRATSAVLLLTLALAVGTFSQSFLATWRQSQADQAAFSTGAPVRFAGLEQPSLQVAALEAPEAGQAQPVLRTEGELAGWDTQTFGGPPRGRPVEILALTDEARQMLDRGRIASEGGAQVAALETPVAPSAGIALPGDVRGLSAVVQVGDPENTVPGASTILRAVLEDGTGLLSTVDLGMVPIDGLPHPVQGMLPDVTDPGGDPLPRQYPLRLVGLQVVMFVASPSDARTGSAGDFEVQVNAKELSVLQPGDDGLQAVAVEITEDLQWFAAARGLLAMSTWAPEGWQIGVRVVGSVNELLYNAGSVVQIGWPATDLAPVLLTESLARRLGVVEGGGLMLVLDGAIIPVEVSGTLRRVPTTTDSDVVVIDQTLLSRALAQNGVSGSAVSEWWVDVAPEDVPGYLAGLPADPGGLPAADRATSEVQVTKDMQQHPLRVATQAGLWLVALAAALLAAVGFGVHATVTLRARAVEFAQLRAIGLSRRSLTAVVGAESLLLCLLGGTFGIGIGALLGWLVGPLVAVSADGTPPIPSVVVHIPWADVAALAGEVVALLAVVVLVVARSQRSADPAAVLRLGEER